LTAHEPSSTLPLDAKARLKFLCSEDDYARFSERLREDVRALAKLLSRERFGVGAPSLGAELEMSMVGATCSTRPVNERVLADTCDPRFTVELNRFNLEIPMLLGGCN
jgi:hypothetical protein